MSRLLLKFTRFFCNRYDLYLPAIVLQLMVVPAMAVTARWTGLAGDGLWASSANWTANSVPGISDDVLLDQSLLQNDYVVTLPDAPVQIRTLRLLPLSGFAIRVLLPATNLLSPAVVISGPGYGLFIGAGAVFENASGIASGESLQIGDSVWIANGGKYIHKTRGSHALSVVNRLSAMPGTEEGVFEFDVPRSSYTISGSNRVYGTLSLRGDALGAPVTYACSGSNTLTVRGDLRIGDHVNFSVDLSGLSGNVFVGGDYVQEGGTFNLASGMGNQTVVSISGNIIQSPGALITETNGGFPVLEIGGRAQQAISLAGDMTNQVGLRMKNPAGALMLAPLRIPWTLQLVAGRIATSQTDLLTLSPDCSILADSTGASASYIDGPLRKEGLSATSYFLFPVGMNGMQHWLELKNATGDFTVEYHRKDPRTLGAPGGSGIDHISSNEYWSVEASPDAVAALTLSYSMPASGEITAPAFLTIARLSEGTWTNIGNTGITGNFAAGSVMSNQLQPIESTDYTLASTVDTENPLPLTFGDWRGVREGKTVRLSWRVEMPELAAYYEIMGRGRDSLFRIDSIPAVADRTAYSWTDMAARPGKNFYQLRILDLNGVALSSAIIMVDGSISKKLACRLDAGIAESKEMTIVVDDDAASGYQWQLYSILGQPVRSGVVSGTVDRSKMKIPITNLGSGMYVLRIDNGTGKTCVVQFCEL